MQKAGMVKLAHTTHFSQVQSRSAPRVLYIAAKLQPLETFFVFNKEKRPRPKKDAGQMGPEEFSWSSYESDVTV
jgi:hypothetical protein